MELVAPSIADKGLGDRILKVDHAGGFRSRLPTPIVSASAETVIRLGMRL